MSDDVDRIVREGVMSKIASIRVHPGIIAGENATNSIRPDTTTRRNVWKRGPEMTWRGDWIDESP
jgi:hypothetical protein